jgi:transcriptional regulator with XRE-family HTH domain
MTRGKSLGTTGTDLRLAVGRNVKHAREHAGLSQRDLCGLTGISQSYLSQVEKGQWNMGLDNIAKIAFAVGVAPYELLQPQFCLESHTSRTSQAAPRSKRV